MKPILKHGPVTDGDGTGGVEEEEENEEKSAGRVVFEYGGLDEDRQLVSIGGRPPMFHMESDTNI